VPAGENEVDIAASSPRLSHDQRPTTPPEQDDPMIASPSIWQHIRRDVILLGTGNIGSVVAQLGFRAILVAALIPAEYGRLSLILSLYYTIMIVCAGGLPNSAARYIAAGTSRQDPLIVRAVIRIGVLPTIVAAIVLGVVAGVILQSPFASLFAVAGLSSLVYMALATGILRGRGRLVPAALILPIAAFSEVSLLALVWFSGAGVTMVSAFGLFCLGNVVGLGAGIIFTLRTRPSQAQDPAPSTEKMPSSRELFGFSAWVGLATLAVSILPLVIRLAATLDSFTVVAVVDVTLLLLTVPQRMGTLIVSAVVPHVTRALKTGGVDLTLSLREHIIIVMPFVLASAIAAFTPIVEWTFDALGRPEYSTAASYLALALLAGPARMLYGLVEGVLVAHGEGRFLALNACAVAGIATITIFLTVILGDPMLAFGAFAAACWTVYLSGLRRIGRLNSELSETA
jgi:O-antigen/teichoic acid export membrane protein